MNNDDKYKKIQVQDNIKCWSSVWISQNIASLLLLLFSSAEHMPILYSSTTASFPSIHLKVKIGVASDNMILEYKYVEFGWNRIMMLIRAEYRHVIPLQFSTLYHESILSSHCEFTIDMRQQTKDVKSKVMSIQIIIFCVVFVEYITERWFEFICFSMQWAVRCDDDVICELSLCTDLRSTIVHNINNKMGKLRRTTI